MISLQIYKQSFIILIGLISSHAFIIDRRAVHNDFNDFRKGFALKRFNKPLCRSPKSHLGMIPIVDAILEPYSRSLEEFPLVTKAMTGFVLCGVADVIAQVRGNESRDNENKSMFASNNLRDLNIRRLSRFATKGFFGAIIWGAWYDISDDFISENNIAFILSETGIRNDDNTSSFVLNALRTVSAVTIEQFLACPIIFGFWEIPAATLLNNAPVKRIPYEVEDKLNNMLIANAKVWTIANLIIYNIPVQYRVGLSNVIDIFWQSIVSDFAADCGGAIEECQLNENIEEIVSVVPSRNSVVAEDLLVTKSTQ